MGFAPIVTVAEQPSFEEYAYEYFDSRPDYPNNTAINSPDWRGIWRIKNKTRVHDAPPVPGGQELEGGRTILTPILQCCIDNPGDRVLLFNLHSEPERRRTINNMMECTERIRREVEAVQDEGEDGPQRRSLRGSVDPKSYPDYSCGTTTDFVKIVRFETRGPASIMFQPVYPANSPWLMKGMMLSPMAWDEIFEQVFPAETNSTIHAVFESETQVHTYTIVNGTVKTL